ncbi:alpha/beta-hydrolase [Hyaloscypha variabilis F]|uniref:Alpha/beta-hydrolase n=1 Tax=Hyaloscypha variabilis (strain UAMH 11265 / GT02V1 / F) TaxID=1149755 RepID=A0A2J6RTT3_HYAVF|nr:alpha/beta-hydrolase [Hyaloscypha variabilis F]
MVEFVDINGAHLAYRLVGPNNGPLFITLHGGRGFGDHKSDFKAYSPLQDVYRVLSFDLRGHGQSSETEPYTFGQLVKDIDGLRIHFAGSGGRVVLCGGSFGGYLAQQYAIEYPSQVSHLILRGTAPSFHHEEGAIRVLEERLSLAPCASREMLVDGVFGAFENDEEFRLVMFALGPLYSESYDSNSALKRNLETVFRARTHNDLYSKSEKYFDYRDQLKHISAKALVLVGEKDWICPPGQSELIAASIPAATLAIFANANHSVHLEKNTEVLVTIRQFLA